MSTSSVSSSADNHDQGQPGRPAPVPPIDKAMLRRLESDADRAGLPPVLLIPAVANALASMSYGQHVLGRIQFEGQDRTAYLDETRSLALIPQHTPGKDGAPRTTTFTLATRDRTGAFVARETIRLSPRSAGQTRAYTIDGQGRPKHRIPSDLSGLTGELTAISWIPAARPDQVLKISPRVMDGGVSTVRRAVLAKGHGELTSSQPVFLKGVPVGTLDERHFRLGVLTAQKANERNTTHPSFTTTLAIGHERLPGVGEEGRTYTYTLDAPAAGSSLETLAMGSQYAGPPALHEMIGHFQAVNTTMLELNRRDGATPGTTEAVRPGERIAYTDLSPDNVFIDKQGRAVIVDKDALWQEGSTALTSVLAKPGFTDASGHFLLQSGNKADQDRLWKEVDRYHQSQLAMVMLDCVTQRADLVPQIPQEVVFTHSNRIKHIDASRDFLRTPRGCGTAMDKLLSLIEDSVGDVIEARPTPSAFTRRLAAIREQAATEEASKKT